MQQRGEPPDCETSPAYPGRVATRLTAIPEGPVPAPGRLAAALLPLADATMIVLLSRPATGSLRRTWVTPATLALALATVVVGAAAALLLATRSLAGGGVLAAVAFAASLAATCAAAAVAIVGVDQRRRR